MLGPLAHFGWSVAVGVVAALGAVVFRGLIALFHNLLFLGHFSLVYDANVHTPPSPWGPLVMLVPVIGAAGVAFLVGNFAPEAKGHGVPEVMDAIYYNKGVIRPVVALDQVAGLGVVDRQRRLGRPRGADHSDWRLLRLDAGPVAAHAGVAADHPDRRRRGGRHRRHVQYADRRRAVRGRDHAARGQRPDAGAPDDRDGDGLVRGPAHFRQPPVVLIPAFETPYFHLTHPFVLVLYPGLGVLAGLVSVVYIARSTPSRTFSTSRIAGVITGATCWACLLVGVIIYVMMPTTGHYHVEGVGYAAVQDVLSGQLSWFSAGSLRPEAAGHVADARLGGLGRHLFPGIFHGRHAGRGLRLAARQVFPGAGDRSPAFAVAGMAGMVGGSTGAAMTAIVMIFEMTLDYNVIIPMTITVALSHGVRTLLQPAEHLHAQARPARAQDSGQPADKLLFAEEEKGHDGHSLPGPGCRRRD